MRRSRLLFGMTLAILADVGVSRAATFTVNSSADLPDRDVNDTICEATFNTGDCTVRAAVMEANAQVGADVIQLQGGTADLTQPGSSTDTESIGDLDITDDVTILGINPTTRSRLDGGGTVLNDRLIEIRAGATVVIEDVVVQGGHVAGAGGGILVSSSASLTLINSHVLDNTALNGGGIAQTSGASVTLQESLVGDNVSAGVGGGIRCDDGTLIVTDSTIANNSGGAAGGLIAMAACAATIDGTTINGNSATSTFWGGHGGGILVHPLGSAVVTNSTLSGNSAIGNGGGIYVSAPYVWYTAYASFNNATVAFNDATGTGGGSFVASGGDLDVENTIIDDNTAGTGPDCGGSGIDSLGHNLIGDTTGCTIGGSTTGNVVNQSAMLSTALDLNDANTGVTAPTLTHALLPGSPAISAGSNASCEASDQRGVARPIPVGGNCDMGAFEAPRCGDGILNPPEQCDDSNTTSNDGCSSTCLLEVPVSGHNEPTVTAVTDGGLVVAYKDCESPFLSTTLTGPPACIPAQSDSVCYFQTGVTGARGDYTIKAVSTSGGKIQVEVDIVKLRTACNGQTLRVSMALNETVEDCTGGGSCTVETRELDEDDLSLVNATCVVASDKCTINAELNNSTSSPKVSTGKRTGIEFRRFKVVRDLPGGGTVDSFVPGVYLP